MALQRSTASFRRQGSSGLIWNDRFLSGEIRNDERKEDRRNDHRDGSMAATTGKVQRSASDGGRSSHGGRLEISQTLDHPPSPEISADLALTVQFRRSKTEDKSDLGFTQQGRWRLDEEVSKSTATVTDEMLSEWDRNDGDS
ncbi:hypothetical protein Bca4012_016774 [Brassica carinata]